jgi:transcriptional regulator with PAS, ATPase and Fis domain
MAHRGTLFLDEIAEMDEGLQAKLLRVLQEQRFRRVGGRDVIESDVRVLTATNRDPMKAMADGKLREDLYYRLNVFTIVLPPLRERREDIPTLALYFAQEYAAKNGTVPSAIDARAYTLLMAHGWPGNVRELKNAIERSALLAAGRPILPEHLPTEVQKVTDNIVEPAETPSVNKVSFPVGTSMDQAEREMIRTTLIHTSGNKTRAAKILGISLKTMHNKVKKYEL